MIQDAFWGILIPFLGTSLGAGCVFFLKNSLRDGIQRALTGFAAGVMVAASVWSLLIPAMEQAADLGRLAFFPAAVGFWLGILFLLLLDHLIPHLHQNSLQAEGPKSQLQRTTMMVLAVTLHNIPEGMAVGVVYAGYLAGTAQITAAGALALSLGIAIQNFPEGAIISMPLRAEGMKKGRAFWGGVLSGIVEPIGAVLTILAAGIVVPALPYLLSFAAGAMLYVVVEELIPEIGLYGGGIFSAGEKRGILNAMNRNGSKKDEDCEMNIEERAAQAAAWKAAGQCNCAQAVLKAFEDKLPVDADTLMKLGAGYAAGMGCMESTCGALIGAVMVAGVATDGKGTPRISKELLQNFQEKCGATICKDLKGVETGAPLCPCPECVRNAVLALGEVLGE